MEDAYELAEEVNAALAAEKKSSKIKKVAHLPSASVVHETLAVLVEPKYKLHLYTSNGLLRAEIARGIYAEYSRRYGDIMRAIHSSNWQTMVEIQMAYINLTKRLKFDTARTPEQISAAVEEMVNAGLVVKMKR